jgi:hypothetical protein
MECNKLKFVVHGRKDGDKFILERITIYIIKDDAFEDKAIIVTLKNPCPNQYYKTRIL